MRNYQYPLHAALALACVGHSLTGCTQTADASQIGVAEQSLGTSDIKDLAKQCGLTCPDKGIADGNAQISGVASVDAFFSSVVHYQNVGLNVSQDIDVQLRAIRADFNIAADADLEAALTAQFKANVDGAFKIEAEPARCVADTQATLQATARCDAKVDAGSTMLACKGSCDVTASAEASCDASADLECTVKAPSVECKGECQGTCSVKLDVAAVCDGICEGECMTGTCSGYHKGSNGFEANGQCTGKCLGTCKAQLSAGATCAGTCEGECTTTNPAAGCKSAAHVECKAKADAMVMCDGHCEGEVIPPSASAECEASAKADAKVNVTCTPPRLAAHYSLVAVTEGSAAAKAQARFVIGVKSLEKRLPLLLASLERARFVAKAGVELVAAANTAVKSSVQLAAKGKVDVKIAIGLGCAVGQLDEVDTATTTTTDRLKASVDASEQLTTACGMGA